MRTFRSRLPIQRVITTVAPLIVWLTSTQVDARLMPPMPLQQEAVEAPILLTSGLSQPTPPPARPQQPTSPGPGHSAELRETVSETERREREQRKSRKTRVPREHAGAPPPRRTGDRAGAEIAPSFGAAGLAFAAPAAPDPGAWQPVPSSTAPAPAPARPDSTPPDAASAPVEPGAAPTVDAPPVALPTPAPTPIDAPAAPPAASGPVPEPAPAPFQSPGTAPLPYSAPPPTSVTRDTDPTMACPFGRCRNKAPRAGLPRLSVAVGKGTLSLNLYADVGYAFGPQRKHRYKDYITGQVVEDFGRRDFTSYPLYVNQFSLAYGFVQGQYELPEKLRVRFSMHTGHIVESLYFEEKKSLQLIREAALMYYIVPQVAVEAGILPSYYGAEIVLNKENIHATRAYIADFTPDYEAGARLHIFPRKDMALRFMVLNGWQEIRDANGRKGYGFVWSVMRPGQIVGDWCMYWGNEAPLGEKLAIFRHYQNLYYRIWLGKRWLIFPMFDLVMQKNNMTDSYNFVVSPALSVRYGITDRVGVALRWDYLYNKADIVPELKTNTPNGWQSNSGTATLEYLPLPQLTLRLEGRYGTNKDAVFRNSMNTLVREDWYVILGAAFHI